MKSLLLKVKQVCCSKTMFILLIISVLMQLDLEFHLIFPSFMVDRSKVRYLDLIPSIHVVGVYDLFAPLFACFSVSTLFCDEYRSGFSRFIMTRKKRERIFEKLYLFQG